MDNKMELENLSIKEFLRLLENNFINGNISIIEVADVFDEYISSKIENSYENKN
jgi:hypothetical protein